MVKVINDEWICSRPQCSHPMGVHHLRYEQCMICNDNFICTSFLMGKKEWEIIKKEKKQYERRNTFIGKILNKLGV